MPLRLAARRGAPDFTTASLYEALDARRATRRSRADYELEARGADEHEAELLGLAPDAPVLFATTVAIGEDGRVLDLGRTVYRADRYRFQATLMRRTHTQRGSSNEETLARAALPVALAIAVSGVRRNAG